MSHKARKYLEFHEIDTIRLYTLISHLISFFWQATNNMNELVYVLFRLIPIYSKLWVRIDSSAGK